MLQARGTFAGAAQGHDGERIRNGILGAQPQGFVERLCRTGRGQCAAFQQRIQVGIDGRIQFGQPFEAGGGFEACGAAEPPFGGHLFAVHALQGRDGHRQFSRIFEPFNVMVLLATAEISPDADSEMSLPLMVMVPSFFITRLAAPTVMESSSPAVMS